MRPRSAYIEDMNTLFALLFIACSFFLLCQAPENFLAALLEGGAKAATTCAALIATYAVWMGLIRLWEDSGVARFVAKLVKPLAKKLLKTKDEEAIGAASMNISVNLLGISGAATPYGVACAKALDKTENAEYSSAMFFVLNATSLQLLPASMVAVRVAMQSGNPTDIILPTLLTTAFSTLTGVLLTRLLVKTDEKSRAKARLLSYQRQAQRKGVCTR